MVPPFLKHRKKDLTLIDNAITDNVIINMVTITGLL